MALRERLWRVRRLAGEVRQQPRILGTELRRGLRLLRYRRIEWEISRQRATRILEIGVHRAERAPRLIEAALKQSDQVNYWGFDLFAELATPERLQAEAMPGGRPFSLADTERVLKRPGVTVKLIPGDTRVTLPEWAEAIRSIDVVFLDGGHSYETVRSDWLAIAPLLHSGSIVFFDDYIVGRAAEALGCGVATVVDEIDRSQYRVQLLHPIDTALMSRPPGFFRTRLAKVTKVPSR